MFGNVCLSSEIKLKTFDEIASELLEISLFFYYYLKKRNMRFQNPLKFLLE